MTRKLLIFGIGSSCTCGAELRIKLTATIKIIHDACEEAGVSDEPSLLNFVVSDGKTVR